MSKTFLDSINPVGSGNEVYVLQLSIHLLGKTCKQECLAVKLVPLLYPVSAREQYEWADHYWSTSCFLLQWVWYTVSQRFPHVNVFVRHHVQLAPWKVVATLPLHPWPQPSVMPPLSASWMRVDETQQMSLCLELEWAQHQRECSNHRRDYKDPQYPSSQL